MVDFPVDALPAMQEVASLGGLWVVVSQVVVPLAVVDEVLPVRLFLHYLPLSRLLPPYAALLWWALREDCLYVLFCFR